MKYSAIWFFSLALLSLPLIVWFSFSHPATWANPLYVFDPLPSPSPNTPFYQSGTVIPSRLSSPLTFTAADNPILLSESVIVEPTGQLIFAAGSTIYANRFSSLTVRGNLSINGQADQPVTFTTNEQYPDDQTWSGITIQDGGQANIQFARLRYASPAISCLPKSRVAVSQSLIALGSLGAFINNSDCTISDTIIRSVRNGLIIKSALPQLTNNIISATNQDIQTFDN